MKTKFPVKSTLFNSYQIIPRIEIILIFPALVHDYLLSNFISQEMNFSKEGKTKNKKVSWL